MPGAQLTTAEIVQRGQRIYEQQIRDQVEADHRGEYLIINVETGEYEMDPDDLVASQRARAKHPKALLYAMRVGYPAAYRLGRRAMPDRR